MSPDPSKSIQYVCPHDTNGKLVWSTACNQYFHAEGSFMKLRSSSLVQKLLQPRGSSYSAC